MLKKYQKIAPSTPSQVWHHPLYFIAFGLGSGAMPFAPGTFGTLMTIPFYLAIRSWPLSYYLSFVLAFIAFSAWLCHRISNETHTHDHPGMCIDEFAGFFVTMTGAPPGLFWVLLGFLLFRLFDIWKPWPINKIDAHVQGGIGMVLDDVVAGVYAMAMLQILSFLF